jgi:hypothetical protein
MLEEVLNQLREDNEVDASLTETPVRIKIIPEKIDCEVVEIKVYPKVEGKSKLDEPIVIEVDPPIGGEALKALLEATDVEVQDGKLISFK